MATPGRKPEPRRDVPDEGRVVSAPVPLSEGDLLVIDPQAYVNLLEMFPSPPCREEDVQAFVLPREFKLFLFGRTKADIILLRRDPVGAFKHNPGTLKWEPVQVATMQRTPPKG